MKLQTTPSVRTLIQSLFTLAHKKREAVDLEACQELARVLREEGQETITRLMEDGHSLNTIHRTIGKYGLRKADRVLAYHYSLMHS